MNLKDYIDVEKFLEQPKKIQEYLKKYHNEYHKTFGDKGIPFMNETELRSFIQSKLHNPSISYKNGELNINEDCQSGKFRILNYKVECDDLLDGYWEIACMIIDYELSVNENLG